MLVKVEAEESYIFGFDRFNRNVNFVVSAGGSLLWLMRTMSRIVSMQRRF